MGKPMGLGPGFVHTLKTPPLKVNNTSTVAKILRKLCGYMPGSQTWFWIFFKIPFSNSLKVFYLHLELPSDQENSNDFVVERLWFHVYREETPF